jgi:hypothetical protein
MTRAIAIGFLTAFATVRVAGAPPRVSSVHPEDHGRFHFGKRGECTLRTITGANFDVPGLELWVWVPPGLPDGVDVDALGNDRLKREKALNAALLAHFRRSGPDGGAGLEQQLEDLFNEGGTDGRLLRGDGEDGARATPESITRLPAEPPRELRVSPPIRLSERDVVRISADTIQARIPMGRVLWVRTRDGWTKPYVLDASHAYWVGPHRVAPGQRVSIGGSSVGSLVALYDGKRLYAHTGGDASRGAGWYMDRYLRIVRIPPYVKPGRYRVLNHNGNGGRFGWCEVGEIEVAPKGREVVPVVNVREHGALGDGAADDTQAFRTALAATAVAKAGSAEAYVPPGTYRVAGTLAIPSGVTLRGACRELTVLICDPADDPAAMLTLASGGRLKGIALRDAEADTEPPTAGRTMVQILRGAKGVSLIDCVIGRGGDKSPGGPVESVGAWAVALAGRECRELNISRNSFFGQVWLTDCERADVVYNRFAAANLSGPALAVSGARVLVDSNVIHGSADGIRLHPLRQSVVHYNECHFRADADGVVAAGPMPGSERRLGMASGGSETTLVDKAQPWRPDQWRLATVLIVQGTGRGQVRAVKGNTSDTLTIEAPWRVVPDETSRYLVARLSAMTVWHYNYFLDQAPMEWTDCVDVLWEMETVHRGGLLCLSGTNRDGAFRPAWFNRIEFGRYDRCALDLQATVGAEQPAAAPALLANRVACCSISGPGATDTKDQAQAGLRLQIDGDAGGQPGILWTHVEKNSFMGSQVAIIVGTAVQGTFDDRNLWDVNRGGERLVDHGIDTRQYTPPLWAAMQRKEPWPGAHFGQVFRHRNQKRAAAAWPYFPPPRPWPPRWMPTPLPGIGKPARVAE